MRFVDFLRRGRSRSESGLSRNQLEQMAMRNLLASQEVMFLKDRDGRFLLVSDGLINRAPGRRREDLIGKTDFELLTDDQAEAATLDEQEIIRTGKAVIRRVERLTYRDRADAVVSTTKIPVRDREGEIIGTLGLIRDITAQEEARRRLAHQALHDSLTGVPNRIALLDRLGQSIAALDREPGQLVLLFVDLDDFKGINDAYGHAIGDEVLIEVARRLTQIARRGDTIARLGGDEFVLLFRTRPGDDIAAIADRVVRAVTGPFSAERQTLFVSCSVGVTATSEAATDPVDLMRQADLAMYGAKRAGRRGYELYCPTRHGREASNSRLARELAQAIDQSALTLVYQPIYGLESGGLVAVEALVRWQHPTRGLVPADEFIPIAERHDLVSAIDDFVLDQACRQLAAWSVDYAHLRDLTVSVNVSAADFRDTSLVARVASALERHQIEPRRLCIEVTESAMLADIAVAQEAIRRLTALGVRVALDDFGTGYSTLAHMQHLAADVLKLDRSFVAQIDRAPRDRTILAAVIPMAHRLGMTVVAEGVETEAQRDALHELGCDLAQGYLFSPPQPPHEIAAYGSPIRAFPPRPVTQEREAA